MTSETDSSPVSTPNTPPAPGTPHWPGWAKAVGWLMVLLGMAFCVSHYSHQRTFYVDEVNLAKSIVDRDYAGLTETLESRQIAPIGFLVVQKLLVSGWGDSERVLRISSLIATLIALPLLLLLIRANLGPVGGLAAMTALIFGEMFINFSAQNKQYAMELLLSTLVLLLGGMVMRGVGKKWAVAGLGAAAIIGVWFSLTLPVVIAGVGLVLLAHQWQQGERKCFALLLGLFVLSAVSFLVNYTLIVRASRSDPELMNYMNDVWAYAYLPIPLLDPERFVTVLAAAVSGPMSMVAMALTLGVATLGAIHLVRRSRWAGLLLLMPLLLVMGVSMLKMYPMSGRLLLFLLPVLVIALGGGVDLLWSLPRGGRIAAAVLAALLLGQTVAGRGQVPINEDLVPLMAKVEPMIQPGDTVYVFARTATVFQWYHQRQERWPMPDVNVVYGEKSNDDWHIYEADIEQLYGQPRVWLIFMHVSEVQGLEEAKLIRALMEHDGGRPISIHHASDSYAVLFDLSDAVR